MINGANGVILGWKESTSRGELSPSARGEHGGIRTCLPVSVCWHGLAPTYAEREREQRGQRRGRAAIETKCTKRIHCAPPPDIAPLSPGLRCAQIAGRWSCPARRLCDPAGKDRLCDV